MNSLRYYEAVKETIEKLINTALEELGIEIPQKFTLEHPANLTFGDYSTNVALTEFSKRLVAGRKSTKQWAKEEFGDDLTKEEHAESFWWVRKNKFISKPLEFAQEITDLIKEKGLPLEIYEVRCIEPGFINFYLSKKFFRDSLQEIVNEGEKFGRNERLRGDPSTSLRAGKVMVEYTDPNMMKPFHIGHLMSNTIGESFSRIMEWNGAEVIRANYYSDIGLNIAKAVWGMNQRKGSLPKADSSNSDKAKFLGECYVLGVKSSAEDELIASEIVEINKKIFSRSDEEVNQLYDLGKKWSLGYFAELYERLGSHFDWLVGESEVAEEGKKVVLEFLKNEVFEESDGAVVFKGEKYNPKLHTRVFINSEGLPTYEAKEIGLTKKKFEKYELNKSFVITGNEQNDYFKVVLEALRQIDAQIADATTHLPHGMLRLPTGKMSSRTGDVITAEELIDKVKKVIEEKGNKADDDIAVGAIKYMILRQGIGNDIIFDFEKSVSTEGDSGVYLQYAYARTNSVLEKAEYPSQPSPWQGRANIEIPPPAKGEVPKAEGVRVIERLLYRFPEIIARAGEEYAPQLVTTYLTELASAFNNFYAQEQIISSEPESSYRLAITKAFNIVMRNGLTILGIPTPERI